MRSPLLPATLLILLTITTFLPAVRCGFVNFDDDHYVYDNIHVQQGLSRDSVAWAFTTFHTGYWHPLTWLTLMADRQFQGPEAAGFHRTNIALHALNVVLLYLFLLYATQSSWRAAIVAALFAVHPLRVESVVWISERKDVLTSALALLTMLAYLRYARDPGLKRYLLVFLLFALTLMAKPMLVTLPALLLLLDLWPLARWKPGMAPRPDPAIAPLARPLPVRPLRLLLLEKLPLLALSLAIALAAVVGQKKTGALVTLDHAAPLQRLNNVPVAYARYLGKLFWPTDLSIEYPFPAPPGWSWTAVYASAGILLLITFITLRGWRRFPHLAVGWLWFLGLLVPVIGIVQVGNQAMADRYTYFSTIGLLIALIYSLPGRVIATPIARVATTIAAASLLLPLSLASMKQIEVWKDGQTLFSHAVQCDAGNAVAWNNLGSILAERGDEARARECFARSVEIQPRLINPRLNLANASLRLGRVDEARAAIERTIEDAPRLPEPRVALGSLLAGSLDHDGAIEQFRAAIAVAPDHAPAWGRLGKSLAAKGQFQDAIEAYQRALTLAQPDAQTLYDLAMTIVKVSQPGDPRRALARQCLEEALKLDPTHSEAHNALGIELAISGQMQAAAEHFRRAVDLVPENSAYQANLRRAMGLPPLAPATQDEPASR